MRISQNLDFCFLAITRPSFFLAPFLSFFLTLLLSLTFVLHILSGCPKKLGLNYKESLEMGPWSIIGIVGHFTSAVFAPKLVMLCFFNLLRQNAIDIQNWLWCGKIYPSSAIGLSRISGDILYWWCHKWYKEHDHSGCVYMSLGVKGLKQKPSKRTCCYWIVNNHSGAKKNCWVLILLQNISFEI